MSGHDGSVVALFPGQGSISSGAGAPWHDEPTWSVVAEVSDVSGVDVSRLLLEATDDEVVRTDHAQLATFALSQVGWRCYEARHASPRHLAGHSLGEITALVAAGVLTLADGARVVAARGRAMAEAAARNPGSMVALMGPAEGALEGLARLPDVWVANLNGPGQVVVSGTPAALEDLVARSRELGWRRASALPVGGAFHSPLMADAQAALDEVLATVTFSDTECLVASNVDGDWHHGGDGWRQRLSAQMTAPVRFHAMVEQMDAAVTSAVEMPPAGVLVGLVKRIREMDALVALSAPGGPT